MPTNVGGSQAFVTERVTEGTSLPVGANLANSFIGVEIQGDTTPYKIDISSLSGRLSVTQEILGVIKPKGKGAYSAGTQYSLMDYVDSGTQHYLYIGDTPSTGTPLTDTTKWTPLLTDGVNGTNGTNGTNGVNAYTTTSAAFTVPAINSSVTISVVNSAWMVSGQTIFIATAGLYTIASIISATSISATNTGASGNAAAAATIASGSAVSPGGRSGTNGTNGADGISAIATTTGTPPNIPATGSSATYNVVSAAGINTQQYYGFTGIAGTLLVTAKTSTSVTLQNVDATAGATVAAGTVLAPVGKTGLAGSGGGGAVGLKFTLNTTAGTPTAGEIRSTNLAAGGTISINPTDTQASASDILGRLGVGAIIDLRNSDSKWVRGTVTTAWTAGSGSFAIGDVRSAGAIANTDTVYLSIASDAPAVVTGGTGRVTMTANRTYYYRTTGTRAGFLSTETDATTDVDADAYGNMQALIDAIAQLDCRTFKPTIAIGGSGARTIPQKIEFKATLGSAVPALIGDIATPSNCLFSPNLSSGGWVITNASKKEWEVKGVAVEASSASGSSASGGILSFGVGSKISLDSVIIGARLPQGLVGYDYGTWSITGTCQHTGTGSLSSAFSCDTNSSGLFEAGSIAFSGSPTFSVATVSCSDKSFIKRDFTTFTGTVTGARYNIQGGSAIKTNSGGSNLFSGSTAGVADSATFCWYS